MMTTPERLRRRQLIEGLVLILLSLFLVYSAWANQRDDEEQRDCLASTTRDLNGALSARAVVGTQANDLRDDRLDLIDRRVDFFFEILSLSVQREEFTEAQREKLRAEIVEKIQVLQKERTDLRAEIEESKAELAKIPIPPYPEGIC